MNAPFPRSLVAISHSVLAGTLVIGGTLHAFQTVTSLVWEFSFYGAATPGTWAVCLGALALIGLGCIQVVSTGLYLRGHQLGTLGLACASLMLIPWLSSPLNLVLLFCLVAMLAEEMSVPAWEGSTEPEEFH